MRQTTAPAGADGEDFCDGAIAFLILSVAAQGFTGVNCSTECNGGAFNPCSYNGDCNMDGCVSVPAPCPVSTEGWTRRVHFVREGGGVCVPPSQALSSCYDTRLSDPLAAPGTPISRLRMYQRIHASMHPCIHASMHPCIHASMHPCISLSAHPPAAPPSRGAQRAARAPPQSVHLLRGLPFRGLLLRVPRRCASPPPPA